MRTPLGSSKMVARSRTHSSPACDPSGVTLTFWDHAADAAATTARKIALAVKCFMAPPVNASRRNVSRSCRKCSRAVGLLAGRSRLEIADPGHDVAASSGVRRPRGSSRAPRATGRLSWEFRREAPTCRSVAGTASRPSTAGRTLPATAGRRSGTRTSRGRRRSRHLASAFPTRVRPAARRPTCGRPWSIVPVFGRLLHVTRMLATLVAEAFHRHGWVYEEKLDGWRIVAHKEGPRVWLVSRTGRDHAGRFPAVAEAIRRLPAATLILDGEIAP